MMRSAHPLLSMLDVRRTFKIDGGLFDKPTLIKALDGITFTLAAGRTLSIVGESGSGKSTLARIAAMLDHPDEGEIWIDGETVGTNGGADRNNQRRMVQMVFQNPYGSLNPRKTVGQIMEEPLLIAGIRSSAKRRQMSRDMLERIGLRSEHYERFPHMFSGGQRQRIAIGRAVILKPKIVVADEPVSALDISIQGQILNLLMDLRDEFGLAYLFISHDLSVVRVISDDVMVLYHGQMMEHGPRDAIFEAPRHPYTQALLAATPRINFDEEPGIAPATVKDTPSGLTPAGGCNFVARCPYATEICAASRPPARALGNQLVSCHHAEALA
jgi:dipeptide transport system ATP-binding protein